jgi:Na+-driven multidrug efflux pump
VRISFIGAAISFVLNLFFNWVFIFGKFGMPRLSWWGAAVAPSLRVSLNSALFSVLCPEDDRFAFRMKHFLLSGGTEARLHPLQHPVLISEHLLG